MDDRSRATAVDVVRRCREAGIELDPVLAAYHCAALRYQGVPWDDAFAAADATHSPVKYSRSEELCQLLCQAQSPLHHDGPHQSPLQTGHLAHDAAR